jgi:DNA polymerase III alpha subunit
MRPMPRLLLVAVVLAILWTPGEALTNSPAEVLSNPERFDGKVVTLAGTVTNLKERVSRQGNPYYTFDLNDGRGAITVFSFGSAPCKAGARALVEGTFRQVKQQGRYVFYNQVDAARVTCRTQ